METGWNPQFKDSSAKLGSLIESLLSRLGLANSVGGWRVVTCWPEIVGDKIASKSKAVRFENDSLMVSVPDSSWRQELLLRTDDILKRIHAVPGGRAVKKIHFVS